MSRRSESRLLTGRPRRSESRDRSDRVARQRQLAEQRGPKRTLAGRAASEIHHLLAADAENICRGCNPYLRKAFMYLLTFIIIFIVYDPYARINAVRLDTTVTAGRLVEDTVVGLGQFATRTAIDATTLLASSGGIFQACAAGDFVGPNAKQNLRDRITQVIAEPGLALADKELVEFSNSVGIPQFVDSIEQVRDQMRSMTVYNRFAGPLDPQGRKPLLLLPSPPANQEEHFLGKAVGGYVDSIKSFFKAQKAMREMRESLNPCATYERGLTELQKRTEDRLLHVISGMKTNLKTLKNAGSGIGENIRISIWRVIILASLLKTLAFMRRMILPIRRDNRLEDRRGPEMAILGPGGEVLEQLSFRMRKSRKASRKRRSSKRKASRKRRSSKRKASRKASRKRRSAKRKASRKRRSVKRKVSRKRRSVKRKVSRKRRSVKRKVSRKRRSVKRKVSRKRKSAKRKASRKRRSAKRKASRKRKSAKRKASRKRKSVKRKASRKRKSTKRKASRKRKSAKRKASRKRKSAKRKASRKRKRCPPGCVKRR